MRMDKVSHVSHIRIEIDKWLAAQKVIDAVGEMNNFFNSSNELDGLLEKFGWVRNAYAEYVKQSDNKLEGE
jgi:hypothetical protein